MRPQANDYPAGFGNYINLVKEDDLQTAFNLQSGIMNDFLRSIPADKWDFKYAEGKWSVKELVQHCIDAERVFGYRALCFARKEQASLPSFEENAYAANSQADLRNPEDLIEEYLCVRKSTEFLFRSFTEDMLSTKGIANNNSMSVLSLGFTVIGHFIHHKNILVERYGI